MKALFLPKNLNTLRFCMYPLIGKTFDWVPAGRGGDDEPYPGQARWYMDQKHDAEIPEDAIGFWVPDEDLV
jgi:hypothetical protein